VPLTSAERRGLDDIVGLLLDMGDVLEAENVMQLFSVHSRTVDIVAVRSSHTIFSMLLCFCVILIVSTKPRDWQGRMYPK